MTSTQKIKDGKPDGDPVVTTERTKDPKEQIIRVGTKCPPASETVEWTEKTPFEVEVRVNPELQPGEKKVIQEGKQGEIKHTVTVKTENGQVSQEESSEKISDPVRHIVEVGSNKTQTELTDKHTEKIPYETIIEYDPNLEAGKMVESVEPVKPGDNPSNNPSKPGKTMQVRKGSYKSKNPTYTRSSAGSLARTGADVAKTAYVGMGMIGAGLVLAVARRRSRRD